MPTDVVTAPPVGLDDTYRWPHADRLLPSAEAVAQLLGPDPVGDRPGTVASPPPERPEPLARRESLARPESVARRAARGLAVAVLAAVAWLAAWSVLPRLLGWQPVLVVGGSMAPHIQRGDVVLVRPAAPPALVPGAVITFADAGRRGELVTHRVVGVLPDGRLRTRGDHNHDDDPQPVPIAAVRGRAVLRLPWIGRPVIWLHDGRWAPLTALVGAAALLAAAARAGRASTSRR